MLYRGFHIEYAPKPIPDFRHDYDWWCDNDEEMCGTGANVKDCEEQIDEVLDDAAA